MVRRIHYVKTKIMEREGVHLGGQYGIVDSGFKKKGLVQLWAYQLCNLSKLLDLAGASSLESPIPNLKGVGGMSLPTTSEIN